MRDTDQEVADVRTPIEKVRAWYDNARVRPDTKRAVIDPNLVRDVLVAYDEMERAVVEYNDKAQRFDLDRAGIESREADAIELIELRARVVELEATLNKTMERALSVFKHYGVVALDAETRAEDMRDFEIESKLREMFAPFTIILDRKASAPIPMILFCPQCHVQHIDAPDPAVGWDNPPHRSHECSKCSTIWRPADVPTTGVSTINTCGERDTRVFVQE